MNAISLSLPRLGLSFYSPLTFFMCMIQLAVYTVTFYIGSAVYRLKLVVFTKLNFAGVGGKELVVFSVVLFVGMMISSWLSAWLGLTGGGLLANLLAFLLMAFLVLFLWKKFGKKQL